MTYRLGLLLLFGILGIYLVVAQEEVDYQHQDLIAALEEEGITDINALEEIALSDSLSIKYNVRGKYFLIYADNPNHYRYVYIGRVNTCLISGCSDNIFETEEYEYFEYAILFDEDKTVQAIKIYNYPASHGHEIKRKRWLAQFIGYAAAEPLVVDKHIDAIAGATTSVYAITTDVERITKLLHVIQP